MRKLLAVDLDGTLLYPKQTRRCISKKNCKFLQDWIDAGNKVVLITSRTAEFIERLKPEINRPFDFLACSSAQISIDGEMVRNIAIPTDILKDVLKKIDEVYQPLGYLISSKKYNLVIRNNLRNSRFFLLFYKFYHLLQFKIKEHYIMNNDLFDDEVNNGEVQKVMVFFGLAKGKTKKSKELNKQFREKYPDIEASWSSQIIEITPKECDKGHGLEYYCIRNNISANDVYVVGDSGNDIAMFNKYHENSYCMEHSYPSVKKYANRTITRVHKLGKLVLKGEKDHESN